MANPERNEPNSGPEVGLERNEPNSGPEVGLERNEPNSGPEVGPAERTQFWSQWPPRRGTNPISNYRELRRNRDSRFEGLKRLC